MMPKNLRGKKRLFLIVLSLLSYLLACFLIVRYVGSFKYVNSIRPSTMADNSVFSFRIQSDSVNKTIRLEKHPLDKDQSMWTFLHDIAATYPNDPSEETQSVIRQFIRFFAKAYPCEICDDGIDEILTHHPPDTSSQKSFSKWTCEVHNMVNRKLEKPLFDCSTVNKRWRN